jgi:hypothetical protein
MRRWRRQLLCRNRRGPVARRSALHLYERLALRQYRSGYDGLRGVCGGVVEDIVEPSVQSMSLACAACLGKRE